MTYEGWKNWDTWNVALWLNNDEPAYRMMRAFCAICDDITAYEAESVVRDIFPVTTPDHADYDAVDWNEVATMLQQELDE